MRCIGVLALQGAVREHKKILEICGVATREVRAKEDLGHIDGLIIPGGESTTIGKLMERFGLQDEIKKIYDERKIPILGTCAGLILLSKNIKGSNQPRLKLMEIEVLRNGFGRQKESFEVDLKIENLTDKPFRAVFIRAPYILSCGNKVKVLAYYKDKIVLAQEDKLIACAFHPELTSDLRLHQYFLSLI